MVQDDPYQSGPPHEYECIECGNRVTADSRPGECPNCEGELRNVSIPRGE